MAVVCRIKNTFTSHFHMLWITGQCIFSPEYKCDEMYFVKTLLFIKSTSPTPYSLIYKLVFACENMAYTVSLFTIPHLSDFSPVVNLISLHSHTADPPYCASYSLPISRSHSSTQTLPLFETLSFAESFAINIPLLCNLYVSASPSLSLPLRKMIPSEPHA